MAEHGSHKAGVIGSSPIGCTFFMKINATAQMEVVLTEAQVRDISLNYLSNSLDWKHNYFIEDEKVCYNATYSSSHSWSSVKIVREASDEDYFADAIFKILKQKSNGQN